MEDQVPRWCQADVKVSSIKVRAPKWTKAKLKQLPEFACYSRRAVIAKSTTMYTFSCQSGVSSFGWFAIEPEVTKNIPRVGCFYFGTKFCKFKARWLFIIIWLCLLPCFALLRLPSPRGAMLKVSLKKICYVTSITLTYHPKWVGNLPAVVGDRE